ncbi:hypothetical protein HYH03_008870 [Edaphochlamys debaryana]|uniref:Protein ENHANCED DISEASE RESISTANCE 2 C-terminal domain-containing protein n=1 Tax=Edaphochlamys debaryana TaxID=47281 RepID=A0A835XZ67_9CHLO|nr:hypothetical protein HYH03_008870 [Edaphochlamys debaryana]|eukprot:KAG2492963.1 hypothetical protein HYH03_008870 [Edaphochlamys debaryana]
MSDPSYHFTGSIGPSWGRTDTVQKELILDSVCYKGTRTGLVVQRGVALYDDRLTTYHEPANKSSDSRTWMLDGKCGLKPASSGDFQARKRGLRPKGKWAITAAVAGVEEYIDMYEITIDWPASWAAAGYTDLVLGFSEREQADKWHEALQRCIEKLKAAKGNSTMARSSSNTADPSSTLTRASAPVVPSELSVTGADSFQVPPSSASSTIAPRAPANTPSASMSVPTAPGADSSPIASAAAAVMAEAAAAAGPGGGDDFDDADSEGESSEDEEDEEDTPTPDDERWVPYRQTNGVAIYYHACEDAKPGEGEYMVSCVIRGKPQRVAAALMRLRSNTTILGPAEHVEVLQPAAADGSGKEVLRLVLTASGSAGFFCAPREIVLERMRKDDEDGIIVIMFKSVDLPNEATSATGGLYGKGLYRKPVRGCVAGGYTIAGLKKEGLNSSESLVTCIIKVDLGGSCNPNSWTGKFSTAAGFTDSFLDRILMSVNLLRDEVEQRRFAVQPFKLVSSAKAHFDEDGALVGDKKAAAAIEKSSGLQAYYSVSAAAAPGPAVLGRSLSRAAGGGPAASGGSAVFARPPAGRMASIRVHAGAAGSATAAAAAAAVEALKSPMGAVPSISEDEPLVLSTHLDLAHVQSLSTMPRKYWSELHVPGTDAPFVVRGPTYLKDRKKIPAGLPAFSLGSLELIVLPPVGTEVCGTPSTGVVEHVARFLPSVREGGAPFSIIIHLVIPGAPLLGIVAVFCTDKHPSQLGSPPADPMEDRGDWSPFDFVLHKFVYGDTETRNKMLKLIPHIASGSWMIKQSVGTTPVILGKALKTTYHCTPSYIEVDIDISANSVANYVTGMVRGATQSLGIDMSFVLEGTAPWELPECLLGAFRLDKLDCKSAAKDLDWSKELPLTAGPQRASASAE